LKKAVLIVSALMLVLSGVAAVSAYEAHVVNVKAHVENALIVSQDVDYGITFPEMILQEEVYIGLSDSFLSVNQTRLSDLEYALYWTPKLISEHPGALDPDCDGYFEPIYPFIVASHESGETQDGMLPGSPPASWDALPEPAGYYKWGWGHLHRAGDQSDIWHLQFHVPVFDRWSNNSTDPLGTWPYVLYYTDDDTCNDDYALVSENFTASDGTVVEADVPHADLGNNLKIQVYAYSWD
jgi:hypothetical protein